MTWYLGTSVACALYGLLVGQLVPALIARVPEPAPVPVPARPDGAADRPPAGATEEAPKPLYADLARRRGLRGRTAVATGVVAGLVGGVVGPDPGLPVLLYLVPLGVALAVIDWHTRLLPTKLIAPSYVAVAGLVVAATVPTGDYDALVRAALGWLAAGGTFFALWFVYPKGMGYGDVRLAGVLGIALGYLGWAELLVGIYAGFVLGGVGGLLLSALRLVDRRSYPFGPFMLLGALLGVLVGPVVVAWYA